MNAAFQSTGGKTREVHVMNPAQLAEQLVWEPGEESVSLEFSEAVESIFNFIL